MSWLILWLTMSVLSGFASFYQEPLGPVDDISEVNPFGAEDYYHSCDDCPGVSIFNLFCANYIRIAQ